MDKSENTIKLINERIKKSNQIDALAESSWESPIRVVSDEWQTKVENDVYQMIRNYGITIDKDELRKLLTGDRETYKRGFRDGYLKAVEDSYDDDGLITLLSHVKSNAKLEVAESIAKQFSAHGETVPPWLHIFNID